VLRRTASGVFTMQFHHAVRISACGPSLGKPNFNLRGPQRMLIGFDEIGPLEGSR
jgi:hypothetical protein